MFNLSVVNVIPDLHRAAINAIAEAYGTGSNSMSVKLQDTNGNLYWGCHAWWTADDYATFSNDELRAQVVPTELLPSLVFLYERIVLDGDSQENWQAALDELGLSIVEESQT